jgi:predicted P-loop ATPase
MDNLDNNQPAGARDITPEAKVVQAGSAPSEPEVRRAARYYIEKGWSVIRLKGGEKRPMDDGWQEGGATPESFGANDNIGVLLGSKSNGLVDLDFDTPQARALSGLDCFFGHLPAFRRTSQPATVPGHRLVICTDAPKKKEAFAFSAEKEKACIASLKWEKGVVLELRVDGCQTVFPPSRLGDDRLVFGKGINNIPEMSWSEVRRRAALLAFSSFAAACYPNEGNRDNFCFLLAGVLIHAGIETQVAESIVTAIAELNGDDVGERQGKAMAAAERKSNGETVSGLPTFLEFIGMQACEQRLRKWLGFETKARAYTPTSDDEFETKKDGSRRDSQHNVRLALAKLGVRVKLDLFRNRILAGGLEVADVYVDDAIVRRLWLETDRRFGFLTPKEFYFDVVADAARANAFHPVRDYLDSLTWDGTCRLSNWLATYAGTADTEFIRAVGRITLIAAVRRVRQPGCKFDQMLILEGEQGGGKSTLVRTLAVRDEWFADEAPLGADGKLAIEMLTGKWLIESAELKSLKNSEVEHVKAFLSRQSDRGREAYGHLVSEVPRQCIFIGTTNSDRYLMDPTGNRRFWSVKVGRIDVEGLKRDRDQLWAEAAYWEAKDESIQLPEELWGVAATEQAQRVVDDPYLSTLAQKLGEMKGKIVKNDVYRLLDLPIGQRHTGHERRVGEAMRALGWRSTKLRRDGKPPIACFINCDEADAIWIDVRTSEGGGETWAELSAGDQPRLRIA